MKKRLDQLNELALLKDNWDEEGAPPLSLTCIEKTKEIIEWAFQNKINIDYVDADVMGGTAIGVDNDSGKYVWISIKNNGAVYNIYGANCRHGTLDDVKEYLKEDDDG